MNYTEHKITLDIHKTVSQVSLRVKKGDTGRRLLIHFAELGYPYHISEDCYAVFTALKPDGKVVFNDCSIVDCVIIYDFTEQTVAAVGMMDCEIILYGGNGKQLTSASFNIIVEDTVYDKETEIESRRSRCKVHLIAQCKPRQRLVCNPWTGKILVRLGNTFMYLMSILRSKSDTPLAELLVECNCRPCAQGIIFSLGCNCHEDGHHQQ